MNLALKVKIHNILLDMEASSIPCGGGLYKGMNTKRWESWVHLGDWLPQLVI